jgi:hypothetical protein
MPRFEFFGLGGSPLLPLLPLTTTGIGGAESIPGWVSVFLFVGWVF